MLAKSGRLLPRIARRHRAGHTGACRVRVETGGRGGREASPPAPRAACSAARARRRAGRRRVYAVRGQWLEARTPPAARAAAATSSSRSAGGGAGVGERRPARAAPRPRRPRRRAARRARCRGRRRDLEDCSALSAATWRSSSRRRARRSRWRRMRCASASTRPSASSRRCCLNGHALRGLLRGALPREARGRRRAVGDGGADHRRHSADGADLADGILAAVLLPPTSSRGAVAARGGGAGAAGGSLRRRRRGVAATGQAAGGRRRRGRQPLPQAALRRVDGLGSTSTTLWWRRWSAVGSGGDGLATGGEVVVRWRSFMGTT